MLIFFSLPFSFIFFHWIVISFRFSSVVGLTGPLSYPRRSPPTTPPSPVCPQATAFGNPTPLVNTTVLCHALTLTDAPPRPAPPRRAVPFLSGAFKPLRKITNNSRFEPRFRNYFSFDDVLVELR
jgi:hypothetical protein